jgi:hypothetical protein
MYNPDTDLLFPPRVIPQLRDLRDPAWSQVVDHATEAGAKDPERLAFVLLMVRLSGCVNCQSDSYRAMQGCTLCASQAIKRFRGSEDDLAKQLAEARQEVECFLEK